MKTPESCNGLRRRRLLTAMSVATVVLSFASMAWACVPSDRQTRFQGCTNPDGSRYRCKPLFGTTPFPNATSIAGAPGAVLTAYVNGGLFPGWPFNMIFIGKPDLVAGKTCTTDGTTVIGGPVFASSDQSLPPTTGTIPTNAPLGKGQVCFVGADGPGGGGAVDGSGSSSVAFPGEPATFKVVI